MCGRYSLALPLSLIQQMLEDDGVQIEDIAMNEGSEAHHQSYNFAPGSNGVVCRAGTSNSSVEFRDKGHNGSDNKSPRGEASSLGNREVIKYILQSMKWGILPSWSKQNVAPTRGVINCRDDSLRTTGGMWQSIKGRKRCIVVAQGFFEWLNVSGKEKHPYFIKRRDGHLMCFAGLWDSIQHQDAGNRSYTYAIVTTDSNQQLRFLHHRMPVIFDAGSKEFHQWLYPLQQRWTNDLQSLLKPFQGELDIYPVNKKVGKVGCSSPSFIMPLSHNSDKHGISQFFPQASEKSAAENSETPGEIRKRESDNNQHLIFPSSKRDVPERADSPRKHKADSSSYPPPKKRRVKPAPQGVQRITDFFGQMQHEKRNK
ncbi:hypothetical protein M441DRAFT_54922 [Trichoderma asperellum CBS 433.97]|uniref:DUF159 domain protein n=1 Tax=Trichoderma asperellum (strain ATCC 204424 / CBS 433.97 / NBRC 101777) TaxID=1042311 RepID=A0A2T3ZM74_TRIA4|nr:hypothetical protein M441DRAFT_54922 [Trichoderma asperellum CBS 433.97]PTB45909.1 hypothetical protein M441DRAFT_54922 [Trichoderma asperellum CBS 433.97]